MISLEPRMWPFGPDPTEAPSTDSARRGGQSSDRRTIGLVAFIVLLACAAGLIAWLADGTDLDFLPFVGSDKPTVVLGATTDPLDAAWDRLHPPSRDAMIATCTDDARLGRGIVTVRVVNGSPNTSRYRIVVDVVSGKDGSTIASGTAATRPLIPLQSTEGLTTITARVPAGSTCNLTSVERIRVG